LVPPCHAGAAGVAGLFFKKEQSSFFEKKEAKKLHD
jgi:hypothetical protein